VISRVATENETLSLFIIRVSIIGAGRLQTNSYLGRLALIQRDGTISILRIVFNLFFARYACDAPLETLSQPCCASRSTTLTSPSFTTVYFPYQDCSFHADEV
jgi:hypothetical protein